MTRRILRNVAGAQKIWGKEPIEQEVNRPDFAELLKKLIVID